MHLTLDMGGAARFGPNVEWLATDDPAAIDYTVAPDLPARFAPLIAAYWPRITADMLAPGYSGVRPKAGGPKDPNADFRIDGPEMHGLPGLVNLFGIESPGLTSSPAIGPGGHSESASATAALAAFSNSVGSSSAPELVHGVSARPDATGSPSSVKTTALLVVVPTSRPTNSLLRISIL